MTSLMHDYWDDDVRMELRQPAPGAFYPHPYGGIARDIPVTREGFARFFELDVDAMELDSSSMWFGKIIDIIHDTGECLGYRGRHRDQTTYVITILNQTHGALMDHAIRTTVPTTSS